jgi:hypothetical protein
MASGARSARAWARERYHGLLFAAQVLVSPPYAPPGHWTSPLASARDTEQALRPQPPVGAIDLHEAEQVALMKQLEPLWHGLPDQATAGWRYRSSDMFAPGDATVYYALLQHLRPARIVETGSGFTSALALDVRDRYLPDLELTFIEPHPERLYGLLRDADRSSATILPQPIQDVPLETYDQLRAGDILFVDTSHVAKTGSEVNWVFFNVLPRLVPGVIVHVHDTFWPFEYPRPWLEARMSWSELYLLRAFLMYNERFRVMLFTDWLWQLHPELFTTLRRDYDGGTGSLWLRVS